MKIKLKRKVILKKKSVVEKTTPDKLNYHSILLSRFTYECKAKPNAEAANLRIWWEEIFNGEFPPWHVYPYELVKAKLMYELLRQDYENSNVPIPARVQQNINASRDFNIDGFTDNMKLLIGIGMHHSQSEEEKTQEKTIIKTGGNTMAKNQAKQKVTKTDTILRVLKENEKNRFSDLKLASLISLAHPGSKAYTDRDVKICRTKYNSGRNWGMTARPKTQSKCYDKPVKGAAESKVKAAPKKVITKKKVILKKKK